PSEQPDTGLVAVTYHKVQVNFARVLTNEWWWPELSDRYRRRVRQKTLKAGEVWTFEFGNIDTTKGGVPADFGYPEYGAFIDGFEVARCRPESNRGTFTISADLIPDEVEDGHVRLQIVGYDAAGR